MKHYRKPSGIYIELEDSAPVSELLVPVSQRPSINHVFSGNWQSDPLNPAICWRLKTTQELGAEKQDKAQNLLDYKIAIKALAQVTWNALPDLKTAFPTYQDYQTAIINQYKALI